MRTGRPRLRDPTIPAHIVQTDIPRGAYWSRQDRHWYTFIVEGGARRRRKLAGPEATLADLHRLLEAYAGVQRDTLGWLCDQYNASDKFKGLSDKSKADYLDQRKLLDTYQSKRGPLSGLAIATLSAPFFQRVVDKIGAQHPSKANHLLRYVRRCFSWGLLRGYCTSNPAKGVEQARERKRRRLPPHEVITTIIEYARAGYTDYLWIVMELAYLCRLRGIEVLTLTDAQELPAGILTERRKGSNDSVVKWSPRLTAAWKAARARRDRIWAKKRIPAPIRPIDRLVLVNDRGAPLSRKALDTIWGRMMRDAVAAGVITTEQRFGSHDLKRRGITDTTGGKAAKKDAGGHKTDSMLEVYDFEVPEVDTPRGV